MTTTTTTMRKSKSAAVSQQGRRRLPQLQPQIQIGETPLVALATCSKAKANTSKTKRLNGVGLATRIQSPKAKASKTKQLNGVGLATRIQSLISPPRDARLVRPRRDRADGIWDMKASRELEALRMERGGGGLERLSLLLLRRRRCCGLRKKARVGWDGERARW
ncbi:hypothetical protein Scep_030229 [Stephania cephalantha]|uniref:Uncharacterized protein n=1 Tax=Stephania cephalantha TaxID=152367 RepID=A0AAP0HCZ6_9MAGN